MLERGLIVWLGLLSALAYFWPAVAPAGLDPFIASKPVLPVLIAITMFSVGCLMRPDELQQVLRDWRAVLSGTIIQYTATPLLAYGFARAFPLEGGYFIGVIIVGCVPGAMASNVLTLIARGNVSYSVSLTTCSTILSPVVVPLAMFVCLRERVPEEFFWQAARELMLIVVGPVIAGRLTCWQFRRAESMMRVVAPLLAPLVILWIIAVVVATNRDRIREGKELAAVLGALAGVNGLGYLTGYFGGAALRFTEGMRRALTIEIGMQNAGLGVALAGRLFPDYSEAAIPPALFTVGSMITATLLVQAWVWNDARLARHCSRGSVRSE